MIKIERKPVYRETLRLKDGRKRLKVKLEIGLDDITTRFMPASAKLITAQDAYGKDPSAEHLTDLICAAELAFQVIFGADAYQKMLDFFGGNTLEMMSALTPVLENEITPKIYTGEARKAAKDRK